MAERKRTLRPFYLMRVMPPEEVITFSNTAGTSRFPPCFQLFYGRGVDRRNKQASRVTGSGQRGSALCPGRIAAMGSRVPA